ncbi:NifU-like protein [anaerobic digester metagenome]|jgi:nitrogen fixation NifU-like protein|uniref:NifU-like protein n=1 Tax=anaerobic digester metagenome TaxID=1263854 RepID=A0A485LZ38_9ZZZZ
MDEQVGKKHVLNNIAVEHAENPRNLGNTPNADGFSQEFGEEGDSMAIWVNVKDSRIDRATFWTDGCGAYIACGSMLTELAKSQTIEEASRIEPQDLINALEGLPDGHLHVANLAVHTLREALKDYQLTRNYLNKAVQ